MKPIVYIASPYTKGDPSINANFQMRVFDDLMNDGLVWPVAPLMSHYQHTAFPRPYKDWIEIDLALIERFDACLRLNATCPSMPDYLVKESPGADREVDAFKKLNRPVFYSKEDLYNWIRESGISNYKPCLTYETLSVQEDCTEGVALVGNDKMWVTGFGQVKIL